MHCIIDSARVISKSASLSEQEDRDDFDWLQLLCQISSLLALFGLAKAAEWLNHFYTDCAPPEHIYILCQNTSALQGITKVSSYDNQTSILLFYQSLTSFCSQHRDVDITLAWSPVNRDRIQDTTAWLKAMMACTLTPRASLNRVQSAAYQKQVTRKWAFTKWAEEWHAERCERYGRDSFAYEYTLTKAPSGQNHPLWKAAVDKTDGAPCFSRHTTSTAL